MKCKQKSILSILSVLLLIAVFAGSALALSGDGTNIKHTGGGSSVSGAYLVPSSGADHHVGFRFTWLTKDTSGNYTRKAALDVFYKGYNPNSSWGYHIKATVSGTTYRNLSKYEYKRWFDTVTIDREYYTDTNYKYCNRTDIPVTLPADEAAMTTWGKVDSNINTILNKMVSGATVANMKAADFVFIEPIYRVKIEGTNYCITVTEMGLIGCVVCSNSSTGNEGSGYGSGWVTIRRYTNYNWPDALKTTATHAGISAGTALSSSSYATFENMVKKGFGLMVVWNTSPHVLTVYYQTGTGASSLKIGSSYKLASDYTSYSSSYIRNSSNNYFTQTVNYDNNLTLMNGNSSGFNLTRDYYAFSKWQLSGTSTYFNGGASAKASALNASVATANQSATLVAVWSPISYTITYNLNGGKIGSSTTNPTQTYNYETDVYIGNYTSGATAYTVPTKSGYNFGGWKYTGSTVGYWTSGTTYANGYNKGEYEHGNVTLTAQWTPVTYTVTYNANGGSGAPSSQSKTHGVNLTLSSTKPTRTGYTFNGWNTKADGTGTNYSSGGTYTGNANLTLYAKWTANQLTVAYDCYQSSATISDTSKGFVLGAYNRLTTTSSSIAHKTIGGTDNVYYQTFTYNNELGGSGLHDFATFGLSAPTGYRFTYWKCGDNGELFDQSTTTYKPSDFTDEILTSDGLVWLTAQFTPNTYSVKFNGNGSTSGSMSNESFTYGTAKALTKNAFSRAFTVTYNYNGNGSSNTTANAAATFNGWATSTSGSKVYNDRQSVSNLSSTDGAVVNLYAKWTDGIVTLPSPTRTGYTFNGWYTTASGGTKIGNGGASYTVSANVTLYAQWTPIAYTIRFDKNGAGSGSMANLAMTYDIAKNLTKSTFVRSGYTFSGWNTRSDGTGTAYSDEQSVKNLTTVSGTVITLYAQWTPDSYTIRFNGNGATAGTMADMSMTSGVGKYLPENAYTKTGYAFTSWNTKDNGSGVAYANRAYVTDIATMGDTVVLYAQWSPIRYTVRYNGNGATSGTMQDQGFVYDTAQNLIANAFKREFTVTYDNNYSGASTSTAKAAATFNGWASTAGGAIAYTDGQNVKNLSAENGAVVNVYAKWTDKSVTLPTPKRTGYVFDGWYLSQTVGTKVGNGGTSYTPNANVTLYAHWTPIIYTIRFKGNGSTSGSMADMAMTYDVIKSLTANAYKRTGYVFKGWNTQANGSGTGYADKQTVKNLTETNNVTITLYVQWTPITYTVRFNGNGADTGTMPDMTLTFDVEKPLTTNTFVKNGMVFLGWNTKQDGSGTDYTDKQIVKNLTETQGTVITLYAQWQSQRQLSLEAVTPNAGYRETTDVITAFNLVNSGPGECLPSDNVSVVFKVYKGNSVIKTVTQNQVVVPGNERNLFYFKWNVPSGITASKLYISAEIVENGKSYGLIKNEYATCKYNVCATPDTQYEASGPDGFTVPSMPTVKTDTAKWSVWVFNNNSFSKISYGLSISNDTAMITPDASANAEQQNGAWVMKSGYGYRLSLKNNVNTLSGYSAASSEAYTKAQYALVLFPEFSYAGTENNCRTAELVSGKWVFRQNSDYGRIHFTPLWFPDGPYTATVVQSDCWTPAGMITRTSNTNTITIFGSAYDDWYIG